MWLNKTKDISKYIGFVYRVTEIDTGKIYIGLKKYYFKKTLPPLKGYKRKRKSLIESDWKTYNTSNTYLMDAIQNNPKNYKKEILKNFEKVSELKAYEAYLQLKAYFSGEWKNYINEYISFRGRLRK